MSAVLRDESAPMLVWHEGTDLGPGLWLDVPNAVYHAGPGISKSGLDDLSVSAAYFKVKRENPQPPSPAMLLGTVLHALVLEPDTFDQRFVPMPQDAPKRPSDRERYAKKPSPETLARCAWWDAFEAEHAGKTVVPNTDGDTIWDRGMWSAVQFMRDAILSNADCQVYLDPRCGVSELSCYWVDIESRRLCRCRPDFWNSAGQVIVDLKSSRDATLSGFQRSVHDYRYDVQDAFYTDGMRMAGESVRGMVFIACEKDPPYHCAPYDIEKDWKREGRIKYQRDLHYYSKCLEADEWPGIPPITRVLPQPGYARYNPVS